MKSSAGWGAALLLAVATWFGISRSAGPHVSQESPNMQDTFNASPAGKTANAAGNSVEADTGCEGIQSALKAFFSSNLQLNSFCPHADETDQSTSTDSKSFASPVQPIFLIATLPDPAHTHLASAFDHGTEAIQHAVADEDYTYDSSWLPWQQNEHYTGLADKLAADIRQEHREAQPGVLLFRKRGSGELESYSFPLIVFIVGEQPTAGVNKTQFRNALQWIQFLNQGSYPDQLRIMGPFSSGALDSLAQVLNEAPPFQAMTPSKGCDAQKVLAASGTASSAILIDDFNSGVTDKIDVCFVSFAGRTNLDIQRYLRLLTIQGYNTGQVALIAEDESGFGTSLLPLYPRKYKSPSGCVDDEEACRPGLTLDFPRDVASLRSAYQRQGLLSQPSSEAERSGAQRRLAEDLSDSTETDDTIKAYSGSELNLSDESELLQIVLQLRQSNVQYLILAGSNIDDEKFLAEFFRSAYPQGRIVIAGSDQLLFRDHGPGNLRGVLTLSPYPLSPEAREWTLHKGSPYRNIYTSHQAQGIYFATRYLLRYGTGSLDLPDYGAPSWLRVSGQLNVPPTWLSVISSGRPWPVAALNRQTLDSLEQARRILSKWGTRSPAPEEPFEPSEQLVHSGDVAASPSSDPITLPVPVEFRVAIILCMFWAGLHAVLLRKASMVKRPRWRAYFCRIEAFQHALMINLGWACIGCATMSLGWFARDCGQVVRDYWPWQACLYLVIAVSALMPVADWRHTPAYRPGWVGAFTRGASAFFVAVYYVILHWCLPAKNLATSNALHWRAMHLLSGVSPASPLVLLCIGGYLWSFQSIHGCALMNLDRPRLPLKGDLELDLPGSDPCPKNSANPRDRALALRMYSQEAYNEIETNALPLGWGFIISAALIAALLFAAGSASEGSPLESLGPHFYAQLCGSLMVLLVSIALAEARQLWRIWQRLQELLAFLDRLMLRRTLRAIKDFSWISIWYMSGAVLDHRYQILSRQIETLRHVENAWENFQARGSFRKDNEVTDAIHQFLEEVECRFGAWFSTNYRRDGHIDQKPVQDLQCKIAWTSAVLLRKVLIPEWRKEMDSLVIAGKKQAITGVGSADDGRSELPLPPSPLVRSAEEFVCLNYLAFIQNVMGRMRTLVAGMGALFVATALSASVYPLNPRPLINDFFVIAFVALATAVIIVFAQAHRDATLSNVTNTTPGDLGGDFYLKVIQFAIGPALGLLSVLFPSIADFLFSWIQPGQMR